MTSAFYRNKFFCFFLSLVIRFSNYREVAASLDDWRPPLLLWRLLHVFSVLVIGLKQQHLFFWFSTWQKIWVCVGCIPVNMTYKFVAISLHTEGVLTTAAQPTVPLWCPFTLTVGCSSLYNKAGLNTANHTIFNSVDIWNRKNGACRIIPGLDLAYYDLT